MNSKSTTPAVYSEITVRFLDDGETFSASRPSGIIDQMVDAQSLTKLSREEHMAELAKRAEDYTRTACPNHESEWLLLRTLEKSGFVEITFDFSLEENE